MVMEILNKQYYLQRSKLFISLFTLMVMINSCRKEATVDLPETAPKPVLVCFISPEDSLIRVKLTNSVPLYTDNSKKYPYEITNAIITISDGSITKNIPLFQDTIGYQLSTTAFTIKPGSSYTLEVKIPDGRALKATTTVPAENFPPFNFSIEKNLVDSNEFGVNYEFIYELSWTDVPAVSNFYRSVIYNLFSDSVLGSDTTALAFNELFESDMGKDGSVIKITGQSNLFYVPGSSIPINSSNYIAYLMLCNKDYFDYHKDLYSFSDLNPFSESKLNFSNVEGGIGCFGAYRLVKKRF